MEFTPDKLLEIRKSLKLLQSQAAQVVSCTTRSWQGWEYGERPMPQGIWELFLLKTKQVTVEQVLEWDQQKLMGDKVDQDTDTNTTPDPTKEAQVISNWRDV